VLAEAVVHGRDEARPEPGIVFGGEVGGIVWELVFGRRCGENFGRGVVEDGEELGAGVGGELQ